MDASADFPMNDDEPARNVIEIPSSDRATALEFAIDRLQRALREPTCSQAEFTTADADIDLHDLWDDMKERLKRQPWASGVHLSRVSNSFLSVKNEGERHSEVKDTMANALSGAVRDAGLASLLVVKVERSFKMEAVGINGAEESIAPDVSLCCDGVPLVWIEISDSQRYREVVEKMMLVSASRRSVKKFVIVHLCPPGGNGELENSDQDFLLAFQLFDRLVLMRQLATGRYCTLNFRPSVRRNPDAQHPPRNEVPQPEDRTLRQHFDLVLMALRVFQFTNVAENPIYRIFGDDNILSMQFSAVLPGNRRLQDITLDIDMSPILEILQRNRDGFAARAAEALRHAPRARRFIQRRINYDIEPSVINAGYIPVHISTVFDRIAFERPRVNAPEWTPAVDVELLN